MANQKRGEVKLEIGGESVVLRPTFDAVCNIEDETGYQMMTLLRFAFNGQLKTKQCIAIIRHGAHATGVDLDEETLRDFVMTNSGEAVIVANDFLQEFALAGKNPPKAASGSKKTKDTRSTA